jgi:hypothetical protein
MAVSASRLLRPTSFSSRDIARRGASLDRRPRRNGEAFAPTEARHVRRAKLEKHHARIGFISFR